MDQHLQEEAGTKVQDIRYVHILWTCIIIAEMYAMNVELCGVSMLMTTNERRTVSDS